VTPGKQTTMWIIILAIAVPVGVLSAWYALGFLRSAHPAQDLQLEVISTAADPDQPGEAEVATVEATFTNTTRCPLTELELILTALDDRGVAVCTRTCVLLTAGQPTVKPRRRTTLTCEIDGIPARWSGRVAMQDEWSLDAEYDYSARLR